MLTATLLCCNNLASGTLSQISKLIETCIPSILNLKSRFEIDLSDYTSDLYADFISVFCQTINNSDTFGKKKLIDQIDLKHFLLDLYNFFISIPLARLKRMHVRTFEHLIDYESELMDDARIDIKKTLVEFGFLDAIQIKLESVSSGDLKNQLISLLNYIENDSIEHT